MPDNTLRDELSAGFDGAGVDPSADDVGNTGTAAPDGTDPGVSGEPAALEPPKHWTETDRSLFGKAPREIQQRWLSRETEYAKGYNTTAQQLAQLKKDRESYDEIFAPMDQQLGLSGLNRHQFVGQLVKWNDYVSRDPVNALRAIAQRFGVDLKKLVESPQQNDPQLSGVLEKFDGLNRRMDERERAEQQRALQENVSRVEAFATAKGADGKLLRPHFDAVASDVVRLIKAGERDLETAYNKACRMNDEVWTKVQAERTLADQTKKDKERTQRVDAAKRAAVGSNGEGNGTTKPKSLREDLEAGFSSWPG